MKNIFNRSINIKKVVVLGIFLIVSISLFNIIKMDTLDTFEVFSEKYVFDSVDISMKVKDTNQVIDLKNVDYGYSLWDLIRKAKVSYNKEKKVYDYRVYGFFKNEDNLYKIRMYKDKSDSIVYLSFSINKQTISLQVEDSTGLINEIIESNFLKSR